MLNRYALPILDLENIQIYDIGEEDNAVLPPKQMRICFRNLLHFVVGGKGTLQLSDGQILPLKSGDVFGIFDHERACYQSDETDPLHYYWVGFGGADGENVLTYLGFTKTNAVIPLQNPKNVAAAFENLFAAWETEDKYYFLSAFFGLLCSIRQAAAAKPTLPECKEDLLKRAVTYMELNVHQNLKINDLIEHLHVARSYFARVFKEKYDESPHQYYTRIKIREAKNLLEKHPEYNITQISEALGFPDVYSFSKIFKRELGLSPNEYRKEKL